MPSETSPPQPFYVFRGHAAQVHAVGFSPSNNTLITGDADGFVVQWNLATRRPAVSWKAHETAVLGLAWLGEELVISHGRDSKLTFWHLDLDGQSSAGSTLPVDHNKQTEGPMRQKPPILYQMTVNTLNFCSFACCWNDASPANGEQVDTRGPASSTRSLLLALPHTLSSEAVDIYELFIPRSLLHSASAKLIANSSPEKPSPPPGITSSRVSTIPAPSLDNPKTGLTMCLALPSPELLIAGYEGGQALVYALRGPSSKIGGDLLAAQVASANGSAEHAAAHASWIYSPIYLSRPHSQPILSLAVHPQGKFFVTTSADAVIARHRVPLSSHVNGEKGDKSSSQLIEERPEQILNTKHAGQQGISFRDDGMIFATAGWDSRGRIYRAGMVDDGVESEKVQEVQEETEANVEKESEHADGKAVQAKKKVKNMKELAVLKWHKEGCYCIGFAHVVGERDDSKSGAAENIPTQASKDIESASEETENNRAENNQKHALIRPQIGAGGGRHLANTAERREEKARNMHWLAMGSKDGRLSLWDIF